jgi:very-short-patch-repair endonuclease
MRRDKSDAEHKLWRKLRNLTTHGFHFRQQAPIGPYITDFCDHTAKLVVEVDGAQHGEPKGLAADRVRTRWLASQGYRVLRFWNHEVLLIMEGVEVAILVALGVLREDGRDDMTRARDNRASPVVPSPLVGEGQGGGDRRALDASTPSSKTMTGSPPTPSPFPPGGGGFRPRLGNVRRSRHG